MIRENLENINERIRRAAKRAGRDPETVKLVAVSKRKPSGLIEEAYACGQSIFAENYFQEARDKIETLNLDIKWHFIGHLQSNKAAAAAELFDMIETVDRIKIVQIMDRTLQDKDKILPVLVQVNIGNESQKSGIDAEETEEFLVQMKSFNHIKVMGLMVIPPYSNDSEATRPYFRFARELLNGLAEKGLFDCEKAELSMGMSGDFEVAIEEGATMVRVGTALFGARD